MPNDRYILSEREFSHLDEPAEDTAIVLATHDFRTAVSSFIIGEYTCPLSQGECIDMKNSDLYDFYEIHEFGIIQRPLRFCETVYLPRLLNEAMTWVEKIQAEAQHVES